MCWWTYFSRPLYGVWSLADLEFNVTTNSTNPQTARHKSFPSTEDEKEDVSAETEFCSDEEFREIEMPEYEVTKILKQQGLCQCTEN